jgi:hypothetical protein
MNDFQMINLAAGRSHDFHREAHAQRLAKSAPRRTEHEQVHPHGRRQQGPSSALRLTISHLFGRAAA